MAETSIPSHPCSERTVATLSELVIAARESQMVLAISGTPATEGESTDSLSAFDLADLSKDDLSLWIARLPESGRVFVGTVMLKHGAVAARLVLPVDEETVQMLTTATLAHIIRRYNDNLFKLGLAPAISAAEAVVQ